MNIMTANDNSQTSDSQKKLVIILLGAPGSGKGTQAQKISSFYGIPHISTGDLFRKNIKENTALGQQVKAILDSGKLVPDSITLDMLYDRLKQTDCQNGYLLDGMPRTIAQAEALEKYFGKEIQPIVINIAVNDDEVIRRISGRRICPNCNSVYHVDANPPKNEGICDTCGTQLIQRADDRQEVVAERLKNYYRDTKPLENFYKTRKLLFEVDGSKSPETVFKEITLLIKK